MSSKEDIQKYFKENSYVVIKDVSKLGFFLPKKNPIPIIKKTGNKTSKSFK